MNTRRRRSRVFVHNMNDNFPHSLVSPRRSALHFWTTEYVKRLISTYPLSFEVVELVFSLGNQNDRLQYLRENSDWLFVYEDLEEEPVTNYQHRLRSSLLEHREAGDIASLVNDYLESEPSPRKANQRVKASLKQFLNKIIPPKKEVVKTQTARALEELRLALKLNDTETELLRFFFCMSFSGLSRISKNFHDMENYLQFIHVLTGKPIRQLRQALDNRSRLLSIGLIATDDKYYEGLNLDFLLNSDLVQCLTGHKTVAEFFEKHITLDRKKVYPLESFNVAAETVFIAQRMLLAPQPIRLLVHGLTGTGKTEFVRSLCRSCQLPTYFLRQGMDGAASDRKTYLEIANQLLSGQKAVVVVDEADELLNTRYRFIGFFEDGVYKGWLNDFLDRSNITLIFITNDISAIEDSVLRRFHFNIQFNKKVQQHQGKNWQQALQKKSIRPYLSKEFIQRMIARYHLTPASLHNAIHTLELILKPEDYSPKTIENYFEKILSNHELLVYKNRHKLANILQDKYDPNLIHTDHPPQEIITSLKNYLENSKKETIAEGVNLLFWGMPGTGKTEFAKYLAQELGKEIIVKRACDLLNPWLGVTEKLIANAFEEASQDKSILFIDEADNFFIRRESAHHSWEITHTNEFLNQMENHNTILICCTNLIKNLDPATLRRFHFKVEFKPLREKDRLLLFERYFPNFLQKNNAQEISQTLLKMNELTPGNFKTVYHKLKFSDLNKLTAKDILTALAAEVDYCKQLMEKKITGFSN